MDSSSGARVSQTGSQSHQQAESSSRRGSQSYAEAPQRDTWGDEPESHPEQDEGEPGPGGEEEQQGDDQPPGDQD